jgi:trafficking protein particle complex subunit 10
MQYDVEEMVKEWLVSGKKRGNFSAMVGANFMRGI